MKRTTLLALVLLGFSSMAQDKDTTKPAGPWNHRGYFNFNIAQTALSNWNAGGQNSVAWNVLTGYGIDYKKGKWEWVNTLEIAYGINSQGNIETKTDDRIEFSTRIDRSLNPKKTLWLSGFGNFRTQFTKGYRNPEAQDSGRYISNWMAPGYATYGIGITYKPNDKFEVYLSPAQIKNTFVLDQALADSGQYGVDPAEFDPVTGVKIQDGQNIRWEIGAYLNARASVSIMENITYEGKLDLFANYLNNPQNIDVNWENLFLMKVNKFITVSLHLHLIYDDDINFKEIRDGEVVVGPRTQFKETLGVGVAYKFD
ncbi:MAG: DUF3078 domain-containing protein [Bacteroidota bacterium]|nr:DUF3078 domain-containing protein [Bacteroidota bacterium]